ncbi:hypothetical protein [Salinisphaera sp.]|uniref:hypothetical protein n=1 Tax=Salinisphaera sp. TaxID=1914330 RepID=UPI000C5A0D2E|nr:hypothetical protein [Salinisphaera sp.]MAS10889.1 hypothetical protein [Salinisphaera sp.]|tara:strand:+ start:623 stop:1192 length:570 start_codon:yes stop_codon:yes gene_type:complete
MHQALAASCLLCFATLAGADGIEWTNLPKTQQFDGRIISLGHPEDDINVGFVDFLLAHLGDVVALDVELAFLYGWGDLSIYCEPPTGIEENETELRLYYFVAEEDSDSAGDISDETPTAMENDKERTREELADEYCGLANFYHVTLPTAAFYPTGVGMAVQLYRIKGEFVVTTSHKWKRYIGLEPWPHR